MAFLKVGRRAWTVSTVRDSGWVQDQNSAIRFVVPDARYEFDDLIAEDDKVVVRWRLLGTHEGVFGGIAPTNQAIALKGIAI